MLVDATNEFSFEQIHQRAGKFSWRSVEISEKDYDLLDAASEIDRVTRMDLPHAENQLLSNCVLDTDHFSKKKSTVNACRDDLQIRHAEGRQRASMLQKQVKESRTQNPADRDGRNALHVELQEIENKRSMERAMVTLKAGIARCSEYCHVERYYALSDPRMSKMDAEICYLALKNGDHSIISYRDPRFRPARKIPTSDAFCPLGSTSLMSERLLNSNENDWKVLSKTGPDDPRKIPDGSFLESMNFGDLPELTSDDRRLEIIFENGAYSDNMFNRISAAKDISVEYVSDSRKKSLSFVHQDVIDLLRLSLQRRDELMQKKIDSLTISEEENDPALAWSSTNEESARIMQMRQAAIEKFTAVV